jgi:virginiamycin B lyase
VITEFELPSPASFPNVIARGPGHTLFFAESEGNRIGRITTEGVITEFPVPTPNSQPIGVTEGPDDETVWFTEGRGNKIGVLLLEE